MKFIIKNKSNLIMGYKEVIQIEGFLLNLSGKSIWIELKEKYDFSNAFNIHSITA